MNFPVFVEHLSLDSLAGVLHRLQLLSNEHSQKLSIFYIDGSSPIIRLITLICRQKDWKLSQLPFKLINVKEEESDDIINLCIQTDYLWKVKDSILSKYPHFLPVEEEQPKFRSFLEKNLISDDINCPRSLARTLYFVQIIRQWMNNHGANESALILRAQPWGKVMEEYADSFKIRLFYIRHWYPMIPGVRGIEFSWHYFFTQWANYTLKSYCPEAYYWIRTGIALSPKRIVTSQNNLPKLAVFPQNQWHFENDGLNSEIFLTLQSNLPNQSLLLPLSNIPKQLYAELTKHQISTCQLNKLPAADVPTPFFLGTSKIVRTPALDLSGLPPLEKRQLKYLKGEYDFQKSYWMQFFREQNIKVYTTWHKNGSSHIPIGDALRAEGGIMSVWQRSYEEFPDAELSTNADISFGFSPRLVQTEKIQGSKIKYHVATGYIKDYNQVLLRPQSIHIRKKLMIKGAKKIVSVFDENSMDDSRWHTGHELPRKHYGFWSEKVMKEPWLGVIFKPKKPKTLRQRLGAVNFIVTEAEKTGRLVILEKASQNASIIPPVLAAMASDIAIQGQFFAGTTALECALAGVPSLAVDYEGWKRSFRYQLGEGKVIFPNNEDLWEVLIEHWNSKDGVPGLGDWSPLLDEMDPFRDGRAAERMGNYLHWLIQGFEQGLDRDTIMADAAERYCKQWGSDKISPVN